MRRQLDGAIATFKPLVKGLCAPIHSEPIEIQRTLIHSSQLEITKLYLMGP